MAVKYWKLFKFQTSMTPKLVPDAKLYRCHLQAVLPRRFRASAASHPARRSTVFKRRAIDHRRPSMRLSQLLLLPSPFPHLAPPPASPFPRPALTPPHRSAAIEALTFSSQRFPAPNGRTLADIVLHEAEAARPPGFAWSVRLCSAALCSYTILPSPEDAVADPAAATESASGGSGSSSGSGEEAAVVGGGGEALPSALEPGPGYTTPSAPAAILVTDMLSRGFGGAGVGAGAGAGAGVGVGVVGGGAGASAGGMGGVAGGRGSGLRANRAVDMAPVHRLAVVAALPDRLAHVMKAFPEMTMTTLISAVGLCRIRGRAADAKPLLQYIR